MCQPSAITRDRIPGSRALWTCAAALALSSPAVMADEDPNLLTDTFQVALGTFVITSEPTIQLKGDTSNGDRVDFDEALGAAIPSASASTASGALATAGGTKSRRSRST